VAASSSSTTRNEIPRSEAGNVNASDSENVLAITYVPVPVSCPSPISSTPSPPGSPPLSQFQEGGSDARVAIHAALTGHCPILSRLPAELSLLTNFVHRISPCNLFPSSSHAYSTTLSVSVSDLPNRMELQINLPRLQMVTNPSADQSSLPKRGKNQRLPLGLRPLHSLWEHHPIVP